jgi:Uma2 family endonuclease
MSIADKYRPRFTYEDYLLWEGKWELIEGMPYAMSPAPAPNHQKINGRLWAAFNDILQTNCNTCEVYLPVGWKINEKTVVQPDVLIIDKEIEKEKDHLDFTPALIAEILSPSTAYKDRHEKFELYEQEGVKYYLIVDAQFKKTEIYELIEKKYQPIAVSPADVEFILNDGCRFSLNLENIWE